MPTVLLAYYCALILVASIIGGMIPVWFQLTHRWMQFAVSFVAGVMLGIGVLHMLPHALIDATVAIENSTAATATPANAAGQLPNLAPVAQAVQWITVSLLAGMLAMFFIERFFSFHHHDVPEDLEDGHDHNHDHAGHDHDHHHGHSHAHREGEAPAEPMIREPQASDLSWSGAALGLFLHSLLNGVAL